MVTKIQEAKPVFPSSEESDSDAYLSSSEEEGLPPAPSLPTAVKKSTGLNTMDSGSDSDDFDRPLKSIVSKPMDTGSKLKRPRSRPNSKPNLAASPIKTPTKRPTAAEGEKESKKPKTDKGAGGGEEEGKKSVLFQRLWSDDDEVAILKGMLDYKEKKGADPMVEASDFLDFIKKSVHVDMDRKQLVGKVRRLKKRYKNSMEKRRTFNPHEKKVIELSKKIWGQKMETADVDKQNTSNRKIRTTSKHIAATKSAGNVEMEFPEKNGFSASYHVRREVESSGEGEKVGNSVQFLGKGSVSMGLDEAIVNKGLELCREDIKAEMEEEWRKLHLEESHLFLRKLDLARREGEMIIASLRSAESSN